MFMEKQEQKEYFAKVKQYLNRENKANENKVSIFY